MAERPFSRALADAADGVATTVREQRNIRIQVALGALAVIAAAIVRFDAIHWAVLALTIGAVLAAELFNTALERAVDCASTVESPLARSAKHAAAGAVLLACVTALAVGFALFASVLWHR
ncbi:MAG TPA: diacylglycerol kinase family protein [Candidatus Eremiobacteraceae bacterium]|nr:diacylglycerol kinase family protein [Candidatus Eremiobacteraceae bacterium]